MMDLEALREAERLVRPERVVEAVDAVGVEVVHDEHDLGGVRVVHVEKPLDPVRPVLARARREGVRVAPSGERFGPHEDRACAAPHVLVVLLARRARPGRQGPARGFGQLERLLVHDDHRPVRVVRPRVDGGHVLHRGGERRVRAGRYRPVRLQVRREDNVRNLAHFDLALR